MADFISNIKYRFKTASMLMRFIYINAAVFLVLRILGIFSFFGGADIMSFLAYVELPSSFSLLTGRVWTIITYMFAHYDVMHFLFNMLVLYWFGIIFLEFFSPRHFCGLYITGGIGGALLYIISYSIIPTFSGSIGWLIGASASIMAIIIAVAMKVPNYRLNLLFFGPVSLKWIAIVYVAIDLLSINGNNMGGHIAHIGGALTGALFTLALMRGVDITRPVNSVIDFFANLGGKIKALQFKQKAKPNTNSRKTSSRQDPTNGSGMSKEDEQTLDIILDKIKKSGYTSLTADEKKRLFQVSSKKQ